MNVEVDKLSFVIPCYRAGATIADTVKDITQAIQERGGVDYEIILVNDGSEDDTFEVIEKLCSENARIKGVCLTKNFGQANATLAGFAEVTGDLVLYADADGQSPVGEMWKLVDKIQEGYDVVFAQFREKKNSGFQNFGTKVNNMMTQTLMGKPKDLHMGNFWVARDFIIEEMAKCRNPFPYIGGLFLMTTRNFGTVVTEHHDRAAGTSTYTFTKMLGLWLNGFTAFSVLPLRAASVMGAMSILGSIGLLIFTIIMRLKYPTVPTGYSALMSVFLISSGTVMAILGLLGEYVGRVYVNINGVPQYVVKKRLNRASEQGKQERDTIPLSLRAK